MNGRWSYEQMMKKQDHDLFQSMELTLYRAMYKWSSWITRDEATLWFWIDSELILLEQCAWRQSSWNTIKLMQNTMKLANDLWL